MSTGAERNNNTHGVKEELLVFDAELTAAIKKFAHAHLITVNTLTQGVWSLLLSKYTGNTATIFGVTVSGRPAELKNAEQRVGPYINALPFCSSIEDDLPITDWLIDLQKQHVVARDYQYTPLNDIQNWGGITGDFFDHILVFENYPIGDLLEEKEWALKAENEEGKEHNNYM